MYFRKFLFRRATGLAALLRLPLRDILSLIVIPPIRAKANRRVNSSIISKLSRVGKESLSSLSVVESLESVKSDKLLDKLEDKPDESRAEFS